MATAWQLLPSPNTCRREDRFAARRYAAGAPPAADAMQQPQIFISYRRDDAAGYARAVNDELVRCFGAERVFIDVDDINAGQPFSEIIQRSVGDSAVLLALIGKRWRGERDGAAPRIFEAGDFVRQEVAAGLTKGLRVIPVLLDGVADARPGAPAAGPRRPGRTQRPRARQHALRGRHGAAGARSARRARRRRGAATDGAHGVANRVVDHRRRGGGGGGDRRAVAVTAIARARWRRRVSSPRPCRWPARKSTANGRPTSPTTGTTPASASASRSPARPTRCTAALRSFASRAACSRAASMPRASASSPARANRAAAATARGGRASLPRPARGRRASLRHADRRRQLAARAGRVRRSPGGFGRAAGESLRRVLRRPICTACASSRRACTSSRCAGRADCRG